MSELVIEGLRAGVDGKEILQGIDLVVRSGEVHAVMGPNGSGKSTLSHVILGRPGYEVTGGSVTLDGADVLAMDTWERAQAGLFLALQYPTEVPGVSQAMLWARRRSAPAAVAAATRLAVPSVRIRALAARAASSSAAASSGRSVSWCTTTSGAKSTTAARSRSAS